MKSKLAIIAFALQLVVFSGANASSNDQADIIGELKKKKGEIVEEGRKKIDELTDLGKKYKKEVEELIENMFKPTQFKNSKNYTVFFIDLTHPFDSIEKIEGIDSIEHLVSNPSDAKRAAKKFFAKDDDSGFVNDFYKGRFHPKEQDSGYIFFDGKNEEQVRWIQSLPAGNYSLFTTSGNPLTLSKELSTFVGHDIANILTRSFKVDELPARVTVRGKSALVEYIPE